MALRSISIDELTIADEHVFAQIAEYEALKRSLRESSHRFWIPARDTHLSWDRALFLNLTFWNPAESADVLCESSMPADVVAHVAWHSLVGPQLERLAPNRENSANERGPTAVALFFAESIASAFDLYLVGRLLRTAPNSDFVETQVSIMGEAVEEAGLSERAFAALLESVVAEPQRAFEDLRALLFDVTLALSACHDAQQAQLVLERFQDHRFQALLHHYQLSNWLLYARAYGRSSAAEERAVLALDATLRAAPVALEWLIEHWVECPA